MDIIHTFQITKAGNWWSFGIPTYIMLEGERYWCPGRVMRFETLRECVDGAFSIKREKARLDPVFNELDIVVIVDDGEHVLDNDDSAKVAVILTYGP